MLVAFESSSANEPRPDPSTSPIRGRRELWDSRNCAADSARVKSSVIGFRVSRFQRFQSQIASNYNHKRETLNSETLKPAMPTVRHGSIMALRGTAPLPGQKFRVDHDRLPADPCAGPCHGGDKS